MLQGKLTAARWVLFVLFVATGCEESSKTPALKTAKTAKTGSAPTVAQPKTPARKVDVDFPRMLPADTFVYLRINDVQRAKDEFINPRHVRDAKSAQTAWLSLFNELLKAARKTDNVPGLAILRLVMAVRNVHVGAFPSGNPKQEIPAIVGFLRVSDPGALDALQKELKGKLKSATIGNRQVQVIEGTFTVGFFRPTPATAVLGTLSAIRGMLERAAVAPGKSLADSARFQQALAEFGSQGELFTFVDAEKLRATGFEVPVPNVSHLAASMGVNGGFALRAYAASGKTLPEELVRTSRRKKLLNRLPRDTALLLSSGFDADRGRRREFARWLTRLVKTDDILRASVVPQGVRELAKSFFARPDGVENGAAGLLKDLWFGIGPVNSETAIFVAPNSRGKWGAAALFDVAEADAVAEFKTKLRELGRRAKLKWKRETVDGLTIHSLDVSRMIAPPASEPVPAQVRQLLQLRLGYAETEHLFAAGSVDLIRHVLTKQESSLAQEFSYEHLDAANAMMFSIQPGRILNRKFGFTPVDDVLRKLATQIPIDSNYTFTLSLEKRHATLRSNIPFTSLIGWLVLEWQGKGPARLKDAFPGPAQP